MNKLKRIGSGIKRVVTKTKFYAFIKKKFFKASKDKDIWADVLREHAEIYRGLFSPLKRAASGSAKKPQRTLLEWHKRTEYNIKDEAAVKYSTEKLLRLAESGNTEEIQKAATELLESAKSAGITQDSAGELMLDETNTNAYTDWEGEQLYLGDKVVVTNGAWYLNGNILEQGYCNKISE